MFLPTPATRYVEACDLLTGATPSTARVLIPPGDLDEETLAGAGDAPPGEVRFLRFVQAPLNPIELARFNNRPDRPRFKAPGRLARVGLLARMLDAGLVASLLVRGKVPGGTAAAAAIKYEAIRAADPRVSYHGRVIRQDGWVVLQYLFFYPMNDWRSTFDGANDHEADWEQAFVILEELPDGDVEPVWFAAAAHDEQGADLRRRWDDPKLQREGEHVVVYPGAGSHATYMEQGEYIMRLALPGAALQRGILDWVRRLWRDTLNQPDPGDLAESIARLVSVPFVDYARGDGYHGRSRAAVRVEPDPRRRRRRVGRRLPRPVGPGHGRPDGGRAGARGSEVHAHGHRPPVVERPPELRGARGRSDTRRDARGPRGPGRGAACRTGRDRRGGGGAVRDPARPHGGGQGAGRDVRSGRLPQAADDGAGRG